ncbi:PepSY domain-containing protein [Ramlibacter tataouinensis]|uniref:PepSY domain-containing protein n=1 Tax=Ramlibacter tataouinensis TaxID=94132 RepID=UPI0002E70AF2|nr:PepSY domain-containing protein [Ramlibacter tataouinensis]
MRKLLLSLGAGAVLMAGLAAPAWADRIPAAELPGEVVQALQKRFRDAIVLEAGREQEGGRLRYEILLRHEGRQHQVDVSPEGNILKVDPRG